jgi:hypothetical protein
MCSAVLINDAASTDLVQIDKSLLIYSVMLMMDTASTDQFHTEQSGCLCIYLLTYFLYL